MGDQRDRDQEVASSAVRAVASKAKAVVKSEKRGWHGVPTASVRMRASNPTTSCGSGSRNDRRVVVSRRSGTYP